jgi:D-alanyl-D-alanine carboxypeptidase
MENSEQLLLDQIKENRSPSIQYAFFSKDNLIKRYTFGYVDIENKKKADKSTTYNVFSVTKTFTALAVLQLSELSKLRIEDPIKDYLPDFPYNPEITIKQVLSHTSGIPNPLPMAWIHLSSETEAFDRDEFFKKIISNHNNAIAKPGEKFAYSNLGYVLLGKLIEKVSGFKYEDYIKNRIIGALGIKDSELGFEIHDTTNHATGYQKKYSLTNAILGFLIDKSQYMGKSGPRWKPFQQFYVNGASFGGLIGTPDALIKYIQELLQPDCKLITDDTRKILFTENKTVDGRLTGMCISWFKGQIKGKEYYTHAGGGGGYYCEIRVYPGLGRGSVVFFNRTGMSDQRFLDIIDKFYL